MKRFVVGYAALLGLAALVSGASAQATTIDLGTNGTTGATGNVGGYTVTAAGAVNAVPYNIGPTSLALSSDGFNSGTPVAGATPAAFNGFASFSTNFALPAGATGTTLSYTNLGANDRFVLLLNGNVLAASGIFAPTTPTPGTFVFTSGGSQMPVTYQSSLPLTVNGTVTGTDTAFFILGGTNTLSVLVNATFNGINNAGTPSGLIQGNFKQTNFGASSIQVTFNSPVGSVPEPATWAMMLLGFGGIGLTMRARRRKQGLPQIA